MVASMAERIILVHEHLDRADIPHAFGGAIALAFHVRHPRTTDDLDLNIAVAGADAEAVLRSLPAQVKWNGHHLRTAQIQNEVRLRWSRGGPVDLFFAKDPYYTLVDKRKEMHRFLGGQIPVVSATDLTVFKTMFGRDQDWVDIEEMLAAGSVDTKEAVTWTAKFLGTFLGISGWPVSRDVRSPHPSPSCWARCVCRRRRHTPGGPRTPL